MAYPFLPVNPCCTDVVINDPCGCSSVISNSGCNNNNPCSTILTASSTIVYDGPVLSCIIAEPCDTLNVILQKIDSIICNLLTQINTLNIQVSNITTQIITINGDIININNQLDNCCNVTTTSTSTTIYSAPCESFLLTNTEAVALAIIITDCITGIQEPIVLLPGDTNICVETDSPLVLPGTVIATPTGPCPSTTTTTTTICEGFSLFNPSLDPIDVIITPCDTGIEELLSLEPGTTYVCLLGGAPFTIDDPIIITPQGPCPTTTTTTTLFIPCECITFTNTDDSSHYFSYTNCDNEFSEIIPIASGEIVSVCGCCGGASDSYVTISVGANCIQGICPSTTSTTTTEPPVICLFTGIANEIPNPITTTTTSSTTCNPLTEHAYQINAIHKTTVDLPSYFPDVTAACAGATCLQATTCTISALTNAYWDTPTPGVGDTVYAFATGCTRGVTNDGFYVLNLSGTYTVVEIVNHIIVSLPTCVPTTTTTTTLAPTTTTTTTVSVCTIPIDTQLWGCANLDVTEYANGDPIPEVTDQATWAALTTGAWCYYNNDPLNGAIYGKLYNWYAVNDPRGLVPAGYHVPTNTDWINLINYLGGDLVAGGPLKEAGTVHWTSPNVGATNSSGFTGLPGGFRDTAGAFQSINDISYWWTSTVIDPPI